MKINKMVCGYLFALLSLTLAGCGKQGSVESATSMVDSFFQAVKNKDFERASGFFMDSATRPRQEWLDELKEAHDKLGELQSYSLQNKIVNTVYSGMRYTLSYKVKYSKYDATMNLIIFEGVSGDSIPQIEVMQVHSAGL